jgi:DNA-binding transcriptional MerR regulator
VPRLNRILGLKELGFSLEDVRAMVDAELPAEQMRGMLESCERDLQARIVEAQGQLASVIMWV